jgi:GT2 family glycosyltransferase
MIPTAHPSLSLVILSYGCYTETTGPCLQTLLAEQAALATQGRASEVELVLVDNGSPDDAAKQCARVAAGRTDLRWLPLTNNLGFGGGMNAGVAASSGEWVCLVNSDTLFPVGALSALLNTLARCGPAIGMVGPVTNAAGNGQCLRLPGRSMEEIVAIGSAEMAAAPTNLLAPTYRSDFFCVAVRRTIWEQLGGLDPAFGKGYYEDFDFSLRLRQAGFEQVIAEDVFIAHVGSASFASLREEQRALLHRNRVLMRQRHPNVRFEGVRDGNADVLRHLLDQAEREGWTPPLRRRAAWRMALLRLEAPSGLVKSLLWHWRIRSLQIRLVQAGVAADVPDFFSPP